MIWLMTAISIYLTYYTFLLSKMTWKKGNKPAAAVIMLLAACFLPLMYFVNKS